MFHDKGNENHAFCFLRAGRSRYDVVHLLGELADRHGELARVFQEGSDGAEID